MKTNRLDIGLLFVNVFCLGGLVVLMALRGPSVPAVLLAIGAAGMAVGRIGRLWPSIPLLRPRPADRFSLN